MPAYERQLRTATILPSFSRRQSLFMAISAVAATVPTTSWGDVYRLALFEDLAKALGEAGDAIGKISDGVARLVSDANSGWNYVEANRTRSRLIDISARTTGVLVSNDLFVESFSRYLNLPNPKPEDWTRATEDINKTLANITSLLSDLKRERSDFVLESAYLSLQTSLSARVDLLNKVDSRGPPQTPQERDAFADIVSKYKILIANFKRAIEELNIYIKQERPG